MINYNDLVISTLFIFILSLILGLIYSKYTEVSIIFSDLEYLLAFFVKLLGFFSFCLFLGILVKRSAFALGFLFVWYMFEGIVWLIIFSTNKSKSLADTVLEYFPLGSMSTLINEPFTRIGAVKEVANTVGQNIDLDYAVHWYEILIVLLWTSLFIFLSYRLLKKRDL